MIRIVSSAVALLTIGTSATLAAAQDTAPPAPATTPPAATAPASPAPPPPAAPPAEAAPAAPPPAPSRATPAAAGGPGDANPNAGGPGGVVVESTTSTSQVPTSPFANRVTPTATGGPGDPAAVAAGPGGFRISALNGTSEIRFRALVQADGRFWFDDTQRPQVNTFLIRRAQPWVEGKLPYGISFLVNPDFGGGTVVLQDAYLGLEIGDALKFRFGKYRPPFGLERLEPTSNLGFVEFGLPTLLTPNRDVGAMVYGDLFSRVAGYAAGIFNGVPDNASADLAVESKKEFDGRVYLRPFELIPHHAAGRLFVGVAGTFGQDNGTPASPLLPSYKTQGQATDFSYIAASTSPNYANTTVANGAHNRYGAYLYEGIGPLGLMGEFYESDQIVGNATKGSVWLHNRAYQGAGDVPLLRRQRLVRLHPRRDAVRPLCGSLRRARARAPRRAPRSRHQRDPDVRRGHADPGRDRVRRRAELVLSDNAKLVANWDHTEFQGGASTAPEIADRAS